MFWESKKKTIGPIFLSVYCFTEKILQALQRNDSKFQNFPFANYRAIYNEALNLELRNGNFTARAYKILFLCQFENMRIELFKISLM